MNTRLADKVHPVLGFASAVPNSAVPDYVSLKDVGRLCIVVLVKNATGVTGAAVTLKQAQDVAGTGEKALSFDKVFRALDCDLSDLLAEAAVASDTFTTDATASKNLMYVLDVDPAKLDVNNGFDCVRLGLGNAVAATVTVLYLAHGLRYGGNAGGHTSKIVD